MLSLLKTTNTLNQPIIERNKKLKQSKTPRPLIPGTTVFSNFRNDLYEDYKIRENKQIMLEAYSQIQKKQVANQPKASEESTRLADQRFNDSLAIIVRNYDKTVRMSLRDELLRPQMQPAKRMIDL